MNCLAHKSLSTLFESVPNAILVVGVDGVILEGNRAALRIFGRARFASPVWLRDLVGADETFDPASTVSPGGAGPVEREMCFLDAVGRPFQVQVTILPTGTPGAESVTLYFHDTIFGDAIEDALFVLKEDLIAVNEALVERNTDLERFASVAAHDLQEPLRKIAIYSDLVRSTQADRLDDVGRRRLDVINASALQMRSLIGGLLLYAHSSGSRLQVEDAPLEELLNQACESVRELILETGATIVSEGLPVVRADRALMTHVLQNLLTNAMKYRRDEPPRVEIVAEAADDIVLIRVSDNGQGFDMKHHDRIFQSFTRLHRKDEVAGTGIGLALCKRVVERHGGRIWAESVAGHGSTFFIRIGRGKASRAA